MRRRIPAVQEKSRAMTQSRAAKLYVSSISYPHCLQISLSYRCVDIWTVALVLQFPVSQEEQGLG